VRYRTEGAPIVCNYYSPTPDKEWTMQTDTEGPQRVYVDVPNETPEASAPIDTAVNDADFARSEENILQWMQYLPEDCIHTMIRMGWDVST